MACFNHGKVVTGPVDEVHPRRQDDAHTVWGIAFGIARMGTSFQYFRSPELRALQPSCINRTTGSSRQRRRLNDTSSSRKTLFRED